MSFNQLHLLPQLPQTLGQGTSAASVSVTIASDQTAIPVSGTFTATNPSVSTTGSAVPASATMVGVKDNSGNLQPLTLTSGGALKVDGSSATQPVSGTVTANAGTGTFAVSASSLPLPTGAATSAKQPALCTAGSAATDVLTVQGIASMTPLKVDGSATTQPVSGTVTANAGTGTFAVSATSLPLPTGAATAAKQPALGTAGTPSADVLTVQGAASMTALKVDGSAVTQPVSGTVSISGTVPVSGTFWQATQPVSGTVAVSSVGGTVTVSGSTGLTGVDYNTGASSSQTQRITEAGRSAAWQAYMSYSSTNVGTGAWVQLVASTGAATTRVRIFDSSGSVIALGVGGSGSEVTQLYIPPGGVDNPFEISIPAGSRVSLKAVDATASSGAIVITALS